MSENDAGSTAYDKEDAPAKRFMPRGMNLWNVREKDCRRAATILHLVARGMLQATNLTESVIHAPPKNNRR